MRFFVLIAAVAALVMGQAYAGGHDHHPDHRPGHHKPHHPDPTPPVTTTTPPLATTSPPFYTHLPGPILTTTISGNSYCRRMCEDQLARCRATPEHPCETVEYCMSRCREPG